ncbi:hypothetical protein BGZ57DRAFT_912709 [Hyaloscypha finlandica]|nr:hypothetical protein BGZ57DRAFT_912709 [Hyaloscypha finlandica]
MAYAHYAVMGGFAVKVDDLHNTLDRATLTTNGILLLAQHGHCFTLSKEAISDKSKANYLAKGLVCVQVLWVAGQAIERKVAGFPISLLEFHTLVHVFCAIVMYMLWFRKPYDINEPTVVPTEDFPNALAFIVASSRWAGASGFQKISDFRSRDWEDDFYSRWVGNQDPKFMFFGKLKATPQTWISKIDKYAKSRGREVPLEMNDDRIRNHFVRLPCDSNHKVGNSEGLPYIPCPKEVELRKAKREKGTFITARDFEPPWFPGETVEKSFKPANGVPEVLALQSGQALNSGLGPNINLYGRPGNHGSGVRMGLSQKDLNRLSMAGNFIQELLDGKDDSGFQINSLKPSYQDITKTPFNPFKAQRIRPYGESLINQRQSNFFDLQELTDAFDHFGKRGNLYLFTLLALAVIAIPAAYGAIHLSAINSLFPTEIELTLWKSSCFILLGFAGLMIAGIVGYVALLRFEVAWRMLVPRWLEDAASVLFGISVAIAIILVSLLYIGARLFIVIESFISLRHVPVGVYLTPDTNFMSYIPHL